MSMYVCVNGYVSLCSIIFWCFCTDFFFKKTYIVLYVLVGESAVL